MNIKIKLKDSKYCGMGQGYSSEDDCPCLEICSTSHQKECRYYKVYLEFTEFNEYTIRLQKCIDENGL